MVLIEWVLCHTDILKAAALVGKWEEKGNLVEHSVGQAMYFTCFSAFHSPNILLGKDIDISSHFTDREAEAHRSKLPEVIQLLNGSPGV